MTAVVDSSEVSTVLLGLIAEIKHVEVGELRPDTVLFSGDGLDPNLGFDSLDGLELALAVEERFVIEVLDDIDYTTLSTIQALTEFISLRTNAISR